MTRPLEWMAAVRDHPERPPSAQCLVLDRLALRMDWQTGCGFASVGQLATDADCEQRTVKRATSWARGVEMLVQTRRGHRVSAERSVSSEWRLCLPQTQGDSGVLLDGKPRGQSTGAKGTAGASQGDSSTPPSRPRSSRPRSSANGAGAKAPRAPAQPETPAPLYLAPPCPECHQPFSQELLADPDFRQMALAGQALCGKPECEQADTDRYLSRSTVQQLIEDGAVAEAIARGIRKRDEFPAYALSDEPQPGNHETPAERALELMRQAEPWAGAFGGAS